MINALRTLWKAIRRLSGDDAYEQYLQHYQQHQAECHGDIAKPESEALPLSREAFFKQWQDKKWTGVKRCC